MPMCPLDAPYSGSPFAGPCRAEGASTVPCPGPRGAHTRDGAAVPPLRGVRLLLVADTQQRAETFKRIFTGHHTVYVALRTQERRRLLREHPPGIAIIAAAHRDIGVERAMEEIKEEGSARVVLVITTDALARTSIELLRRNGTGYLRTSSISLAEGTPSHSLWAWIATLSSTLYLEGESPQQRPHHRRRRL